MQTEIFQADRKCFLAQVFVQLDPAGEAEQVWVWVLALNLAAEVLEEADGDELPGLLHRQLWLQVGLAVQVCRHDVTLALQGGGGEQEEVTGELLLVLDGHDVPHRHVLARHLLQPAPSDYPDLRTVEAPVLHVSEEIFVALQRLSVGVSSVLGGTIKKYEKQGQKGL